MYTNVHMITTVPITEFRRDLFKYADMVALQGYEVEVENKGRKVFRVTKATDSSRERALRALAAAKKLGGKFKNASFDREFFRGKKELEYMKSLGNW